MKVLILTLGTRGDVQPFVALASGLGAAGHEAVLAAPHRFEAFVREHGVTFAGIDDGPMRLLDGHDGASPAVGDVATGGVLAKAALLRRMPAMFIAVLQDSWSVASDGPGAGADVVVHNGQVIAGQHIAERLRILAVLAWPLPMYLPTRAFPWPGMTAPGWLPHQLNRATYAGMKAPATMFGRTVDRWRDTTLRLPQRRGRHDPTRRPDGTSAPMLHAISAHVLPPPVDWPDTAAVTGYWSLTNPAPGGSPGPDAVSGRANLTPALAEFLAAGEPPVFVGFGMCGPDPAATTDTVLTAVRRAWTRAILATGWGGLLRVAAEAARRAGENIYVVNEIPHELLFPRVAAVVHHGGAGTIAAAAAAGRPQVVCPFVADQPFWGRRMHTLGVATPPLDQRHLNADDLATAITRAATDTRLADRAADLGERIRAERGVENAVRELEIVVRSGATG